ncbi:MAG: TolC family protein [Paramuribaculum sp.]|nr:TolC family protein [Paramuribaculum sp.]
MIRVIRQIAVIAVMSATSVYGQEAVRMSAGRLFMLADKQNVDIMASEAHVSTAAQGIAVAENSRLPQINASLTLSYLGDGTVMDRNFKNSMRDPLPHFSNTLGVELYQPLYTGGAVTAGINLARKEKDMAVNSRCETVNSVRMNLITNYLELAKHRNLLQVYDESIRRTEKLITEMKTKHSQGVVLKNDITRQELRLSSLKYDRLATENAIKIFNGNLVSLLGLDYGTEIIPDIDADGHLEMAGDEESWRESAQANSPALKSIGLMMDMERLSSKISHAEYIPNIGIVAGDNLLGPVTFEVPALNKNYNAWFVGVNVKWNISSLFTTSKAIRKHDLELVSLKARRSAAAADIERRLAQALTLYRQSVERLEIERKNVQLADENYSVVYNRFLNQLALLTDMLDASNERLDAGVRLVNAEISTRFYFYQLHYIAGTLNTL